MKKYCCLFVLVLTATSMLIMLSACSETPLLTELEPTYIPYDIQLENIPEEQAPDTADAIASESTDMSDESQNAIELPTALPDPLGDIQEGETVRIAVATDALLHFFNQVYELDYGEIRSLQGSSQTDSLIIWTTLPVTNFSVLLVGYELIDRGDYFETLYIPIDQFGEVYKMQPGDAFMINNIRASHWRDWGMPGVTFVDECGTQRYFLIFSNPDDSDDPFRLEEIKNRTDELPEGWQPRWIIMHSLPNTNVAPPSSEEIAALLYESGISEYGWQAAADFLSGMTSIFTGLVQAETDWNNDWEETGRFLLGVDLSTLRSITTYEVPEIYYVLDEQGVKGVYDRHGNELQDSLWLRTGGGEWYFYVSHFRLFDFDGTGIPDIFVFFHPIFNGWDTGPTGEYIVFRYVDGEYRKLEQQLNDDEITWPWTSSLRITCCHLFFQDETGRIISLFSDETQGSFFGYEQLIITDDYFMLNPITVMETGEWEAWHEHIYELNSPTIFGTDIRLTPLHSFRDLETALFAYLQYKRQ